MSRLRFAIATVGFSLEVPAGPLAQALGALLAPFESTAPADLTLEVLPAQAPPHPGPRTHARLVDAGDVLEVVGENFSAFLNRDGARGSVRCRLDERYPVEAVLKLLLARTLLPRGGLVVHGVGLTDGARAAVFVAESGGGKSTLARCAVDGGLTLLADELVALAPTPGGYAAHGTPWNTGTPARAQLARVGSLGWAEPPEADVLVPHAPLALLPTLLANTLTADDRAATKHATLQAAQQLLTSVATGRLMFAPTPAVAQAVRAAL